MGDADEQHEKPGIVYSQYYKDWEEHNEIVRKWSTIKDPQNTMSEWPPSKRWGIEKYVKCFGRQARDRQFVATESGRLGWVPLWIQKGDHVAVVHGSSMPWVIRSVGNNRWERLGMCYIEGIMYGETMEDSEYKTENIALC